MFKLHLVGERVYRAVNNRYFALFQFPENIHTVNIAGVIDTDMDFEIINQSQKRGDIVDFMHMGAQAYFAVQQIPQHLVFGRKANVFLFAASGFTIFLYFLAHLIQTAAQHGNRPHSSGRTFAFPGVCFHGIKPKGAFESGAGNQRIGAGIGVISDDGRMSADNISAAGHHTRIQHAHFDRISHGLVVHLNRIQRVGQSQNGILMLIGLSFGAGLTGTFHADVTVRIDKCRG